MAGPVKLRVHAVNASDIRTPTLREDGLQLDEHRPFQERFWVVERVAWVAFGLLLVAAILGLTGSGGPLSRSIHQVAGGTIEFPVIARWQTGDELVVRFAPAEADSRRLTLSPEFADSFQINVIQPAPEQSLVSATGTVLTFAAEPGTQASVTLHLTPQHPGLAEVAIGIDDGTATTISSVILP